jgi:hypothetical protein
MTLLLASVNGLAEGVDIFDLKDTSIQAAAPAGVPR